MKQIKLLGTDHDEVIAEQIGRTVGAVTVKRVRLKIPAFRDRRRSGTDRWRALTGRKKQPAGFRLAVAHQRERNARPV